jgi:2-methylcitrate dehydratase PrpD
LSKTEETMTTATITRPAASDLPVTAELTRRLATTNYAELPEDVRALACQCLLDFVAVSVAGAGETLTGLLRNEALEEGGTPIASLIGHPARVSPQQAALINGAASHALDYDDVNFAMNGHPTVTILPALVALAEARGASGRELLAAFVAGYETACRIGALVLPGHYAQGFHATATLGSFGAAAACAHLIGLNAETTAIALGIAGTQAAGLKSMFGTMCKPLHAGLAARNGLMAAKLAARGFSSRADVLECPQGFAATHGPDFHPQAALSDAAIGSHLRNNLFKYHAACYLTHAPIECARALRDEHAITPDAVRTAELRVESGASAVCHILAPKTGLEAKFSLRLNTAFALAGIDTARLDTYSERLTNDPAVVRLRDKVVVDFVPGWPPTLAELRVDLLDGRTLTTRFDSGVPSSDLAAQGRRLVAKFFSLVEPVLGRPRAEQIAGAVFAFDRLERASDLTRLCVPEAAMP